MKIENIDLYFSDNVYNEHLILAYVLSNNKLEFTLILDNPIDNEQVYREETKKERNFIKFTFKYLSNYVRETEYDRWLIDEYKTSPSGPSVVVEDLVIGKAAHRKDYVFSLWMGSPFGDIIFDFKEVYVQELTAIVESINGDFLYYNKKNHQKIDFYNPFNI